MPMRPYRRSMLKEEEQSVRNIKRPGLIMNIKKYPFLFLMVLPGFLYFLIFKYIPMYGVVIAFQDFIPYLGIKKIVVDANWVGLKHFTNFFQSYYIVRIIRNTLVIRLLKLVLEMSCAIILSLLINEIKNIYFKKTVQTISYLPHFLSWVIIAGVMRVVLSSGGPVNIILKALGTKEPIAFLLNKNIFIPVIVLSSVWQSVGWSTIIYLAAISGVDPTQYESAEIDGANRFHAMWYITIPSIMNIIVIMLILSLGRIFEAGFEQILLLYSPAVYEVSDVIDTYVYREGLLNAQYSYGTAVGLFKSIIGLIFVLGTNWGSKKLGHTALW
jgi:putative aldouronate transport system permease protein